MHYEYLREAVTVTRGLVFEVAQVDFWQIYCQYWTVVNVVVFVVGTASVVGIFVAIVVVAVVLVIVIAVIYIVVDVVIVVVVVVIIIQAIVIAIMHVIVIVVVIAIMLLAIRIMCFTTGEHECAQRQELQLTKLKN